MEKLTLEKLDTFRQELNDVADEFQRQMREAENLKDSLEEHCETLSKILEELDDVKLEDDPLEKEAQELADKVAPEDKA